MRVPLNLVASGLRKEKDLEVRTWGRTVCEDRSREQSDALQGRPPRYSGNTRSSETVMNSFFLRVSRALLTP